MHACACVNRPKEGTGYLLSWATSPICPFNIHQLTYSMHAFGAKGSFVTVLFVKHMLGCQSQSL